MKVHLIKFPYNGNRGNPYKTCCGQKWPYEVWVVGLRRFELIIPKHRCFHCQRAYEKGRK